jgi:hypothetical protein
VELLVIATATVRHVHRSCVFEEQADRNMAILTADQMMTHLISSDDESHDYLDEDEIGDVFESVISSCLECIPQPNQRPQVTPVDTEAGFEDDMSSTMECTSRPDQQSED